MFSSKPKYTPGVPYEVQRIYDVLTPKPKELLANASTRRFIKEGEVGVFNHKERRTKKRYLFLFNDILLITKKEGKKSYWLKIFISLKSNLRIEDVPDSATRYKVEFRIYAPKKTIILFTAAEEEKIRWIKEIRECIENSTGKKSATFDPNTSDVGRAPEPTSAKEKEETIEISGDIGKIEIPGMDDESYGDIPKEESEEEDEGESSAPVFFTTPDTTPISAINEKDYGPLPPTPNSTPVQGSVLDGDFDAIVNRSAAPNPPQETAFDPFANSEPLQPTSTPLTPSSSILQPIPANSTPSYNVGVTQPNQNRSDGFAALKSLDGGQQGGDFNFQSGGFMPQGQPQQMFQQNLSIEEQMKRLTMSSPYYNGN
mmetsp:Transcript_34295/g.58726  ORF Transcript_34295/g.58726 Transcript_34295/m.58726 type:complete len:371 (+) Transcript_34295:40-1152(+)